MIYSNDYTKWVQQANLPPLTGNQHEFAEWLLKHAKELRVIGDMNSIFQSVQKYVKTNKLESEKDATNS